MNTDSVLIETIRNLTVILSMNDEALNEFYKNAETTDRDCSLQLLIMSIDLVTVHGIYDWIV